MNLFSYQPFKRRRSLYLCVFFIGFFLSSCLKDNNLLLSEKEKPINNEIPERIISKLQAAGFDTSQGLSIYKDGYIVEYDIKLTEDQLDELLVSNKGKTQTSQYQTSNLVNGRWRLIKVYMDPGFDDYMQACFDEAIERYNVAHLDMWFDRTTNSSDADIRIIAFWEQSRTLAFSSFPTQGNPGKEIQFNTYYYNNNSRRRDATMTIAHEIGHAIGFRHTDYMDRRFSCGNEYDGYGRIIDPYEGNSTVGSVHIPGTPTNADNASWMLACSDGNDRPFTENDLKALHTLYGNGVPESVPSSNPNGKALYRLFNRRTGAHYLTPDYNEIKELISAGDWRYDHKSTTIILSQQEPGSVPLYGYYNPPNDYYYSAGLENPVGFTPGHLKGYVFTSQKQNTIPIYQYMSSNNGHLYSNDFNELGYGGGGFFYEKVAFYAYSDILGPEQLSKGQFIKKLGSNEIFLYMDRKIRLVPNQVVLESLFINGNWNAYRELTQSQFDLIGQGAALAINSKLITPQNMGGVYLLENNTVRHIANSEIFDSFHFDWNKITQVPSLSAYSQGPPIE